MIHTNQWQPDTCGCILEYTWDDQEDQATRQHTPTKTIKACPAHTGMSKVVHYDTVLEENQTKNKAYGLILEGMPELVDEVTAPDGSIVKQLKPGVEFAFSFDEDRKLQVDLVGATTKQKTDVQAIVDTELGVSKIDII